MRHLIPLFAVVALATPAAAFGKGPSEAKVEGPGGGITFKGCCEPDAATMKLAEHAGFFTAAFPQEANRMLDDRPAGRLGPRYRITYTVPGPDNETWTIRQDVYPYAQPRPVTYMPPGQEIFRLPGGTRGGWFRATEQLKTTLVSAGLPETPPSARSDRWSGRDLIVPGLALLLVAAVLLRRRLRPAARMAGSPS